MSLRDIGELFGIAAGGITAIKFAIAGVRFFTTLSTSVQRLTESFEKIEKNLEKVVKDFRENFTDHEARLRVLEDRTDD